MKALFKLSKNFLLIIGQSELQLCSLVLRKGFLKSKYKIDQEEENTHILMKTAGL